MPDIDSPSRGGLLLAASLLISQCLATPSYGAGAGGYSSGIGGSQGAYSGSTVISHGRTGFSIYSQQGVTRVIGEPPAVGSVQLPGGRTAPLIGDGRGGAWLLGAPGNHWIPAIGDGALHDPRRLPGDGR